MFQSNKENVPKSDSLQKSFAEFKKTRHEKFKLKKYLKERATERSIERSDISFQNALRAKFIETAKKYIGMPYAQRYHDKDSQHYNSPLFLDCCALVRQVVYDLRLDFGFTLARWNQAYQYDTLGPDIPFEEMQPGDLIFYSAIYNDPHKLRHAHNMVHVEIYLGGTSSLGARWHKGTVSIFPSYTFNSTTYHSIQYHFKSIRPWLEGVCRSWCSQHEWKDDRGEEWEGEKYSVFAEEEMQEDSLPKPISEIPSPRSIFVGPGNNAQIIRDYFAISSLLPPYSSILLPPSCFFSSSFFLKWTQTASEIDFHSFKPGQQLVNHIPNMHVLSTKVGLLETIRDFETALLLPPPSSLIPLPSSLPPSSSSPPLDSSSQPFSCSPPPLPFSSSSSSPPCSSFPPPSSSSSPPLLSPPPLSSLLHPFSSSFLPKSYRLDNLADEVGFLSEKEESFWILKPFAKNQGKGIKLYKNIRDLKNQLIASKEFYLGHYRASLGPSTSSGVMEESSDWRYVAQKYIEKPLLINKKKFDIRCFVLIASCEPFTLLFRWGYIRLSANDFSLETFEGKDGVITHLTNAAIQKKNPNYGKIKEETLWTMQAFEDYLLNEEKLEKEKLECTKDKIKEILAYVFKNVEPKLQKKRGFFELLGCDIMLDEQLKPYLIEINSNPALFTDVKSLKESIEPLITDTLDTVLRIHLEPESLESLKLWLPKDFYLL